MRDKLTLTVAVSPVGGTSQPNVQNALRGSLAFAITIYGLMHQAFPLGRSLQAEKRLSPSLGRGQACECIQG